MIEFLKFGIDVLSCLIYVMQYTTSCWSLNYAYASEGNLECTVAQVFYLISIGSLGC